MHALQYRNQMLASRLLTSVQKASQTVATVFGAQTCPPEGYCWWDGGVKCKPGPRPCLREDGKVIDEFRCIFTPYESGLLGEQLMNRNNAVQHLRNIQQRMHPRARPFFRSTLYPYL